MIVDLSFRGAFPAFPARSQAHLSVRSQRSRRVPNQWSAFPVPPLPIRGNGDGNAGTAPHWAARDTVRTMAKCVVCRRDLGRHGNVTGNTLDGYTTRSNLCKDCNRVELRRRGLSELADKDQRDDAIVDWTWKAIGWALLALVVFGIIGAVFA